VTTQRNAIAYFLVPSAIVMAAGLILLRLHFQPPTVPRYEMTFLRTPETPSGPITPAEELALPESAELEIEIHPTAPVRGAVGARAFLLRGDELRPWDPPFTAALDGSIRIAGRVDELFRTVPRGSWDVAVAVGRPEVLPTVPHDILQRRDHDPMEAGWHLVHKRIRLDD
jgi:hypothetical protein